MAERRESDGRKPASRGTHFALAVAGLAWAAVADATASRAARGIAGYLNLVNAQALLEAFFVIFLLTIGFRVLAGWSRDRSHQNDFVALPSRPSWRAEFGVGAAIGWGLCLAAVLPLLFTGHLHGHRSRFEGQALAFALSIATLLLATLAEELIFRGYPFRKLTQAVGPSIASVLLAVGFGLALVLPGSPTHPFIAILNGALFGLLLAMAYLRTRGLWIGWGLHFAYRSVMAVVIGLPIAGQGRAASLIEAHATGPSWLTGDAYGLDAAILTSLVLLGGMIILYRVTKEWAWRYTHAPIVAAGYEVTIAPPAAHLAMENVPPPQPPLVQILPATAMGRSPSNAVEAASDTTS